MRKVLFALIFLTGFIMTSCEDLFNTTPQTAPEKLKGTWQVAESSAEFGSQQYLVEFYTDYNDSTKMTIYNFFGLGSWSYVTINVDNQNIVIPEQTEEGYKITGTGTVNTDFTQINMSFTVEEVVVPQKSVFEVSAVLTKEE